MLLNRIYLLILACLISIFSNVASANLLPRAVLDEQGREIGLYERVVTGKGAQVVASPGSSNVVEVPGFFNSYYVFDEALYGGDNYFQVGPNSTQPPNGWIKSSNVVQWSNNLALYFNEPVNRHSVLFFGEPVSLGWLLSDPNTTSSKSSQLLDKFKRQTIGSHEGVIATEPDAYVHWKDKFYVMPVLDFVERKTPLCPASSQNYASNSRSVMLLKTAAISVDAQNASLPANCSQNAKVGVVFVVDTTKSMQPYIDKTKKMVESITGSLLQGELADRVQFGLVGYRDKPARGKNVGYLVNTYQGLQITNDPRQFANTLGQVKAATQSTQGFSEDGLAGVIEAMNLDWQPFQAKWIILITDAGLKESDIEIQGQKQLVKNIANKLWDEKLTGVISVHLATPAAVKANNVDKAAGQYRLLSRWASNEPTYHQIPNGDIDIFGDKVQTFVSERISNLNKTPAQLAAMARSGNNAAAIDLAQRLNWIGQCKGNEAPNIVEGWVVDKALGTTQFCNSNRFVFEPRILLTRQQMNELAKTLSAIVDAAKSTMVSPEEFFAEIALTLGTAASDANMVNQGQIQGRLNQQNVNIQQIGDVLPGYLSRLPYISDFLTIDQNYWSSMSPRETFNWINTIEATIGTLNLHFNKPESELYKLHPAATPGEAVFPVLLSDFP